MFEFTIMVAVITGIVEAIKRATGLNTRYAPLLAIFVGLVYGLAFGSVELEFAFQGLVAGLSSVGLFRTVQKVVK